MASRRASPSYRRPRSDPVLPFVVATGDLAGLGLGRHHVATRTASGEWVRLRPAVYCTALAWEGADARGRLALRTAAHLVGRPWAVASHLSAAALHGWWLPLEPDGGHRAWLTTPPTSGRSVREDEGVVVQVAGLGTDDLVRWVPPGRDPLAVTGPARTAADCARRLPLHEALPLLDAAARGGLSRSRIAAVVDGRGRWPGALAARTCLRLADPRRESWLEGVGAAVVHRAGLPPPEPQVEVYDEDGRFVGRVDHLWAAEGVVLEADGWGKYQGGEDLRREERREDALRALGLAVVRYETRDVVARGELTGGALVAALHPLLAAPPAPAPRYRLRSTPLPDGW